MTDRVEIEIAAKDLATRVFDTVTQGLSKMGGQLTSFASSAAVVSAAMMTMKASFDLAKEGASIERLKDSGAEMARQLGSNMDEIVRKVRAASLNTVSDLDIISSANKAMMLGLGADADKLANLMEVAAFRGRAMGLSTQQAFDDIVRGIGRTSPLILDNLGIVVNADLTYKEYAESVGKSVTELTRQEKIQALLNRVLDEGNRMLDKAGGLVEDNASQYEELTARVENYKNNVKESFNEAITPSLRAFLDYSDAMDRAAEATGRTDQRSRMYLGTIQLEMDKIAEAEKRINQASAARLNMAAALYQQKQATDEVALSQEDLNKQEEAWQKTAQDNLRMMIDITDENRDFAKSQDEIKRKQTEIKDKINDLMANGWSPLSDKVQDLQKDYDDLTAKYEENAQKHEEATRRKLLDMTLEKIAMLDGVKGFSDAEYEKALAVAQTLGAVEEASVREQMALDKVSTAVANGTVELEDMQRVLDIMKKGYTIDVAIALSNTEKLYELFNALQNTPYWDSEKTYRPDANHAHGTAGWQTVPPGYQNDTYMVGLSSGEKYNVVPNGGTGGGGNVVNINIALSGNATPEDTAYRLAPAIKRVLRQEGLI